MATSRGAGVTVRVGDNTRAAMRAARIASDAVGRTEDAADKVEAALTTFTETVQTTLGRPNGPTVGTNNAGNDGIIPRQDAALPRTVTAFSMWAGNAGTLKFARYSRADTGGGNYRFDKIGEFPLAKAHDAGLVTLTESEARSLTVARNEHLAFYSTGIIRFSNGTDQTGWIDLGGGFMASKTSAYQNVVALEYTLTLETQQGVFDPAEYKRVVAFVDNFEDGSSGNAPGPFAGKKGYMGGNSIPRGMTGAGNDVRDGLETLLGCYFEQYSPQDGRSLYQYLNATPGDYVRGSKDELGAADFANIDFALFNIGSAEFANSNRPLGQIGDTTPGTFAGDMHNIILARMQTYRPSMRIFPVIDIPRFDGGGAGAVSSLTGDFIDGNPTNPVTGLRLVDYLDFAREWLTRHNFPFIDMNALCGWNRANWQVYLHPNDKLHPIAFGYRRYNSILASEMLRIGL